MVRHLPRIPWWYLCTLRLHVFTQPHNSSNDGRIHTYVKRTEQTSPDDSSYVRVRHEHWHKLQYTTSRTYECTLRHLSYQPKSTNLSTYAWDATTQHSSMRMYGTSVPYSILLPFLPIPLYLTYECSTLSKPPCTYECSTPINNHSTYDCSTPQTTIYTTVVHTNLVVVRFKQHYPNTVEYTIVRTSRAVPTIQFLTNVRMYLAN